MSAAWPIPAAEMERMEAFRALAELVGLPGITGPEAGLNPRPGSKADSCWQIRHLPDAVRQALGRALMVRGRTSRPHVKIRKGEDVSTVTYVGHGVEIEDDAARLRRRKLEFDYDAARRSHESRPRRRRKDAGLVSATSAALSRWR